MGIGDPLVDPSRKRQVSVAHLAKSFARHHLHVTHSVFIHLSHPLPCAHATRKESSRCRGMHTPPQQQIIERRLDNTSKYRSFNQKQYVCFFSPFNDLQENLVVNTDSRKYLSAVMIIRARSNLHLHSPPPSTTSATLV